MNRIKPNPGAERELQSDSTYLLSLSVTSSYGSARSGLDSADLLDCCEKLKCPD